MNELPWAVWAAAFLMMYPIVYITLLMIADSVGKRKKK